MYDEAQGQWQSIVPTVHTDSEKKGGLKLSARTELDEQNPLPSGRAGPVIRTQPTQGCFMSENTEEKEKEECGGRTAGRDHGG